jgi:hypothetical protein
MDKLIKDIEVSIRRKEYILDHVEKNISILTAEQITEIFVVAALNNEDEIVDLIYDQASSILIPDYIDKLFCEIVLSEYENILRFLISKTLPSKKCFVDNFLSFVCDFNKLRIVKKLVYWGKSYLDDDIILTAIVNSFISSNVECARFLIKKDKTSFNQILDELSLKRDFVAFRKCLAISKEVQFLQLGHQDCLRNKDLKYSSDISHQSKIY